MPRRSHPSQQQQRTIVDENARPDEVNSKIKALTVQSTPILILVYGRHCFHCHEFQGTWNDIADAVESRTALKTLTMEASALNYNNGKSDAAGGLVNALAQQVHGVPYIAVRHVDGSIDNFHGERSMGSILKFVEASLKSKSKARRHGALSKKSNKN